MSKWVASITALGVLSFAGGCGETSPAHSQSQEPRVADASVSVAVTLDASIAPPLTGMHLDEIDNDYQPNNALPTTPKSATATAKTMGKEIKLVLRSSPPGAIASIDGAIIGPTPAFWRGHTDDRQHEFIFVREGYAIARYRFVPTHSGTVHGTLKRLIEERKPTN